MLAAHRRSMPTTRPIGQLVSDATEQITRLVREEMRLAVVEVQQKGRPSASVLALWVPLVCWLLQRGALLAALIRGLTTLLMPWLAALIVGLAVLGVAGALSLAGKKQVQRAGSLVPDKAAASVKADLKTIKDRMHRHGRGDAIHG